MDRYQRQARNMHFCIIVNSLFQIDLCHNQHHHHQGELKLARKNLTMKQIESIIKKLDNNGDGTISLEEMKKGK